jgi:hypothetical protein
MSEHEREPLLSEVADGKMIPDDEGSLLEALAQQRDDLAQQREVDIPLPNYGKSGIQLYVRYRLLDGDELAKIGRLVNREFNRNRAYERNLYASLDVIIEACEGFYVEKEGQNKVPVTLGGTPISGYNQELAQALKFEDKIDPRHPARSCVLAFFGGNVVSVQQHSVMLGRWMGDTTVDLTEEFLELSGNP